VRSDAAIEVIIPPPNDANPLPQLLYGNNPNLQEFYLHRHRQAYFQLALSEGNTAAQTKTLDNRVTKTAADLQHIVDVVSYWNTMAAAEKDGTISPMELKEFKQFKKKGWA